VRDVISRLKKVTWPAREDDAPDRRRRGRLVTIGWRSAAWTSASTGSSTTLLSSPHGARQSRRSTVETSAGEALESPEEAAIQEGRACT
jgi:hypothetical protein